MSPSCRYQLRGTPGGVNSADTSAVARGIRSQASCCEARDGLSLRHLLGPSSSWPKRSLARCRSLPIAIRIVRFQDFPNVPQCVFERCEGSIVIASGLIFGGHWLPSEFYRPLKLSKLNDWAVEIGSQSPFYAVRRYPLRHWQPVPLVSKLNFTFNVLGAIPIGLVRR